MPTDALLTPVMSENETQDPDDDGTYADPGPGIVFNAEDDWLLFEQLESLQGDLRRDLVDAGLELSEMVDSDGEVRQEWAGCDDDPTGVVMVVNAWLVPRGIDFTLLRHDEEFFSWVLTLPETGDAEKTAEGAIAPEAEWPPAPAHVPGNPSANDWPFIAIKADLTGVFLETVLCLEQSLFVALDASGVTLRRLPRPNKPRGRMRPVAYHLTGNFPVIRDNITRWLLQTEWPFIFNGGPADRVNWCLMLPARKVRCRR